MSWPSQLAAPAALAAGVDASPSPAKSRLFSCRSADVRVAGVCHAPGAGGSRLRARAGAPELACGEIPAPGSVVGRSLPERLRV